MIRPEPARVTVIVPTLGLRERAELLDAALASVVRQTDVDVVPIVVLNGTRACPDVERRLRDDPAVRLVRLGEGDLPGALAAGREEVETEYFTALDDDDELLPGALATRVSALRADPALDLVVTNGLLLDEPVREPNVTDGSDIDGDPLRALLVRNWLLPGSWLCRSERVGSELFEGMPRYLECTFLAVRFATRYNLRWLEEPTVVYRVGSPHAESSTINYVVGQAEALKTIAAEDLPPDVKREFEHRIAHAHHMASEAALGQGRALEAWRWHLATLMSPGGWRYLPYTRHLVFGPRRGG